MQPVSASLEPRVQLDEPVTSVLRLKPPGVWSISPDSTVYEAIELMAEKRVGALVVLRDGYLEGIVSERDYARKVILKNRHSQETRVHEIMTAPVLSILPDQPIHECMRTMSTHRVRHLPVVEGERVVGIVSIGDLVNWIIRSQGHTIHQLHNYITGAYPA
jgi:CBS domain-containing protein